MQGETVYHTFKAKDKNSDNLVEYYVTEFPLSRLDEGVQYMVQNFFEHEVMGKTRRIKSDRVAVDEISQMWRHYLREKPMYSIACFKKGCDDIIAMNVLTVKSKNEKEDDAPVYLEFEILQLINRLNMAIFRFNLKILEILSVWWSTVQNNLIHLNTTKVNIYYLLLISDKFYLRALHKLRNLEYRS